jgi:hypothetical protein
MKARRGRRVMETALASADVVGDSDRWPALRAPLLASARHLPSLPSLPSPLLEPSEGAVASAGRSTAAPHPPLLGGVVAARGPRDRGRHAWPLHRPPVGADASRTARAVGGSPRSDSPAASRLDVESECVRHTFRQPTQQPAVRTIGRLSTRKRSACLKLMSLVLIR